MTTIRHLRRISFRTKIVALLLAVEAAVLAVLVWHAAVIELQRVDRDFQADLSQVRLLLNAAVQSPLERRDIPALQRILAESVNPKGMQYLVAKDRNGEVLASAGLKGSLPRLDVALEDGFAEKRYDSVIPVAIRGEALGSLNIGIALDR